MAKRNARSNRRCRNCPDQPESVARSVAAKTATKADKTVIAKEVLTTVGEGQRLWNHVLFGMSTCVGMMQGYHRMGMPGDPVLQLADIIGMLTELKESIEKHNAD